MYPPEYVRMSTPIPEANSPIRSESPSTYSRIEISSAGIQGTATAPSVPYWLVTSPRQARAIAAAK